MKKLNQVLRMLIMLPFLLLGALGFFFVISSIALEDLLRKASKAWRELNTNAVDK